MNLKSSSKLAFVIAAASCLVTAAFSGCIASESDKIGVVVTIAPQMEFIERIGGGRVSATLMVPAGASPHTYEPTPKQMAQIAFSSAYFAVGSGIDFELAWLDTILSQNPGMALVDCSNGIELISGGHSHAHHEDEAEASGQEEEGEHGDDGIEGGSEQEDENDENSTGHDPHIWGSPRNAIKMAQNVCEGLKGIDPKNAAYYEENCDAYVRELELLDFYIFSTLGGYENRAFLIYHPSFSYLARDYGLTEMSIESEGKPPSAAEMAHTIENARAHNISFVFVSAQSSTEGAKAVADEIGGEIVEIDPLPRHYIAETARLADALAAEFLG
ncbi:MAG: zinc ABC transporter substrate-binding protein [Thermoplasmata archaeon HGW-Thermoplasmata-1]|nr:MAG: zinc ABC transporter substrate-binding protein [Thermoplasmata archaeon HGW-Thermoplasmata-1]